MTPTVFIISVIFGVCSVIAFSVYSILYTRNSLKYTNRMIDFAKNDLEKAGFLYNHSYKIINKLDSRIQYLRIFDLKYNTNTKSVCAWVYITTKKGEIGEWYDDVKYIIDIPNKWTLEDCGEWKGSIIEK